MKLRGKKEIAITSTPEALRSLAFRMERAAKNKKPGDSTFIDSFGKVEGYEVNLYVAQGYLFSLHEEIK